MNYIAFNEKFYFNEFQKIPSKIEDREKITSDMISYFKVKGDESLISNFTSTEQSHLKDVKNLLKLNDFILKIILILFFILIFYFRENIFKNISKILIYGGIITDILLIILLILSINFDFAFTLFHKLFFPQGNWTFSPDSLLIQLFPAQFFVDSAFKIFLNSLIIANILILIGFLLCKIKRKK
jgi:integral membrane protein (TIGR01906 family)